MCVGGWVRVCVRARARLSFYVCTIHCIRLFSCYPQVNLFTRKEDLASGNVHVHVC